MIRPMLAKGSEALPRGADWSFEVKWDGIRGIAVIRDGEVRLQSRSGKTEQSSAFPAIAEQLTNAGFPDMVLDGELLRPGSAFFPGSHVGHGGVYVVFDVLELPPQGRAVRDWPLRARRALLAGLELPPNVMLSPVFDDGDALMQQVTDWGWEGVVAKRRDSRYLEGRRTDAWLKVKVRPAQEFIVCGWTEGKNARTGTIGGLVLGYYDAGELVYAGRVGSRLEDEAELRRQFVPRSGMPFTRAPKLDAETRRAHWLEPTVVVQVEFQKWTEDGKLTHPSCKGLRTDKAPEDVVRET